MLCSSTLWADSDCKGKHPTELHHTDLITTKARLSFLARCWCMEGLRASLSSCSISGTGVWRAVAPFPGSRNRCVRVDAHRVAPRERVLRYPDGHERRIIYPAMVTLEEDDEDCSSWDVTGLWTGASHRHPASAMHQVGVCRGGAPHPTMFHAGRGKPLTPHPRRHNNALHGRPNDSSTALSAACRTQQPSWRACLLPRTQHSRWRTLRNATRCVL